MALRFLVLETLEGQALNVEVALSDAEGAKATFFGTDGEGDGFADSAAIGDAAADAEAFAAGLPEDSEFAEDALLAAAGLRELETQAQGLETDVSDAQIAHNAFFGAGGAGEAMLMQQLALLISGLETLEGQALTLEGDVSNATTALSDFLSATNTTFGTSYADSDDIGDEVRST